MMISRPMIN